MYKCNKAFDKNVKECMWILCQNCYDIRLEELEIREASQRKKPEQGRGEKSCPRSSRGSGRNGVVDCCPRHEIDICSLELDENFSCVTKKHIEKMKKITLTWMVTLAEIWLIFIPEASDDYT